MYGVNWDVNWYIEFAHSDTAKDSRRGFVNVMKAFHSLLTYMRIYVQHNLDDEITLNGRYTNTPTVPTVRSESAVYQEPGSGPK